MLFKKYWILWQNERNLNYIKQYNNSFAKKLADSKLRTKEFLFKKQIAVPETFMIIKTHDELTDFDFSKLVAPFVIKPNLWFWGKWIIVVSSQDSVWNYVSNSWKVYTKEDLLLHFSNIVDWFFSISWNKDQVIIERKIELSSSIELIWKYGLPDIRLIVFNNIPIMWMLRIPTKESNWKANIHAWACWAWIDIWTWKITYVTQHWKIIKSVPWIWDIRWIELPYWDKVLELWVKLQTITWIWYLACDIVLDNEKWPLILEVNIRPWLEVQVANLAPLWKRLEKVKWISVDSVEKWVRLWKDLFWWDIEDKIKSLSWKKVVWQKEYVNIIFKEKTYSYTWNINLSQTSNYIWEDFCRDVLKMTQEEIEDGVIKLRFYILWEEKESRFTIKSLSWVNVIIWKNSLKWFFVDPYKYKKWELPQDVTISEWAKKNELIIKNYKDQILKIDRELFQIDKKLLILKSIKPINLFEEKQKFIDAKWAYVPKFEYNKIDLDFQSFREKTNSIDIWDIPLWAIFKRKKEYILNKINFLEAVSLWKSEDVAFFSKLIFWKVEEENLVISRRILEWKENLEEEKEFMTFDEIKKFVKKFNHIYNIEVKVVEEEIVWRILMSWDDLKVRPGALIWKRELRSIIAHEIEWHYLKKLNWRQSNLKIFSQWTALYTQDEEWVAIYNQSRFISERDAKFYKMYENYVIIDESSRMSYSDLVETLLERYENDYEKVFDFIARIKRWFSDVKTKWAFCKDVVYVNWYLNVKWFLDSWWDLKDLYYWKLWIIDLVEIKKNPEFIEEIENMKVPLFL